jgi:holin-like protein
VLPGLLALLACQLVGEFLVRLVGVPAPGPVVGMALLLVVLQVREPAAGSSLVRVAEGLLRHLQLLFVPAGVGVVQYLGLVGASVVPLVAGLLLSWLAALLSTAAVATLLLGRRALR